MLTDLGVSLIGEIGEPNVGLQCDIYHTVMMGDDPAAILEECWRPSFARSLVPKLGGLSRDLAWYLRYYNEERAHTGRLTRGRTPLETLIGARKMRPR